MAADHGFHVDTERLADHATAFDDLRLRADGISEKLRAALREAGSCCGDDAVSHSFSAVHEPSAGRTLTGIAGIPETLAGVGDRFSRAASTYESVDEATADAVRRTTAERE